jgi:hypothetical protein
MPKKSDYCGVAFRQNGKLAIITTPAIACEMVRNGSEWEMKSFSHVLLEVFNFDQTFQHLKKVYDLLVDYTGSHPEHAGLLRAFNAYLSAFGAWTYLSAFGAWK